MNDKSIFSNNLIVPFILSTDLGVIRCDEYRSRPLRGPAGMLGHGRPLVYWDHDCHGGDSRVITLGGYFLNGVREKMVGATGIEPVPPAGRRVSTIN